MDKRTKTATGWCYLIFMVWTWPAKAALLETDLLNRELGLRKQINHLVVKGDARVELENGRPSISVGGRVNRHCAVKYWSTNDKLYLWSNSRCRDSHWRIKIPQIKSIKVEQRGYLNAAHWHSFGRLRQLILRDRGRVNLQGKVVLDQIEQYGRGGLNLEGIESDRLKLIGCGNGKIMLRGKTRNLETILCNRSQVDASQLRTETLFAKLRDRSVLWTQTRRALAVEAENDSRVFYRPYPEQRLIKIKDSALVGYQTEKCVPDNLLQCTQKVKNSVPGKTTKYH